MTRLQYARADESRACHDCLCGRVRGGGSSLATAAISGMKLKLDENMPESLLRVLSNLKHDVDNVRQEGLSGKSDSEIWKAAQDEGRLLLSNYDFGVPIPGQALQLGLDFAEKESELFAGSEMSEDAVCVLNQYLKLHRRIRSEIEAELPHVRQAAAWAGKLLK
jgi:hypothetical protein